MNTKPHTLGREARAIALRLAYTAGASARRAVEIADVVERAWDGVVVGEGREPAFRAVLEENVAKSIDKALRRLP